MNSFLLYLFQVSLVFSSFYLLYKCLFSRFTFHAVNRSLLLLIIPLSLLLPFSAELFPEIEHFTFELPIIADFTVFTDFNDASSVGSAESNQSVDFSFWILSVYIVGVLCLLIRFILTTYSLFKLKLN